MIKEKTAQELIAVAAAGGSLEVDGGVYTAQQLTGLAASLRTESFLKVHNSKTKTAQEMIGIAATKPGQVIFA